MHRELVLYLIPRTKPCKTKNTTFPLKIKLDCDTVIDHTCSSLSAMQGGGPEPGNSQMLRYQTNNVPGGIRAVTDET